MRKLKKSHRDFIFYLTWVMEQQLDELRTHTIEGNKKGIINETVDALLVLEEIIAGLEENIDFAILERVNKRYNRKTRTIVKKYIDRFVMLTKSDGRYQGRFCESCGKMIYGDIDGISQNPNKKA